MLGEGPKVQTKTSLPNGANGKTEVQYMRGSNLKLWEESKYETFRELVVREEN